MNPVSFHAKTFTCLDCKNDVNCLRWKEISNSLNGSSPFKCDNCWETFDEKLDKFCMHRMSQAI